MRVFGVGEGDEEVAHKAELVELVFDVETYELHGFGHRYFLADFLD